MAHRRATRPDAASIARLTPRCALAPAARGSSFDYLRRLLAPRPGPGRRACRSAGRDRPGKTPDTLLDFRLSRAVTSRHGAALRFPDLRLLWDADRLGGRHRPVVSERHGGRWNRSRALRCSRRLRRDRAGRRGGGVSQLPGSPGGDRLARGEASGLVSGAGAGALARGIASFLAALSRHEPGAGAIGDNGLSPRDSL